MRVPVPAVHGPGPWQLPSARQDAERARGARPGTHGGCASWHARRVRALARTAGARPGTHGACAPWHARRVRALARTARARPGTHGACAPWHARRVSVDKMIEVTPAIISSFLSAVIRWETRRAGRGGESAVFR